MYERLFAFNGIRASLIEKVLDMPSQGKSLQPEDLIMHQQRLVTPFIGFREKKEFDGPVVDAFQKYTRSPGMPWGVSFIVYIVNYGIAELLSSVHELDFPRPLPVTPYENDLKELPRTNRPLSGDIVVSNGAWFLSRLSGGDYMGTGMFQKGKRHGVHEMKIEMSEDSFFIDMTAVYKNFIEKSGEITLEKVREFA